MTAGIVSYGYSCASGGPAVNTRVSSFSDFIYNFINNNSISVLSKAKVMLENSVKIKYSPAARIIVYENTGVDMMYNCT